MARIYALVADLFFAERIQNALAGLGHEATVVDASQESVADLPAGTELAIVDLEAGEGALRAIALARAAGAPALAFGPHTDLALRQSALDAGASQVVAKSRLVTEFPNLVSRLLAPGE